jgi:hypothetical protein
MIRRTTPLFVAVIAIAALATVAGSAVAYRSLTIERGGAIRQTSSGKITFQGALVSVACNLTLTGELRSGPLTGEFPILAGQVTRLDWRECTGGTINVILGLPWSINIAKLLERGGQTRIAGIRPEALTGGLVTLSESGRGPIGFELELLTVRCLYGGGSENPAALLPLTRTEAREGRFSYSLGALTILEEVIFRKHAGSETCPGEGIIRGRFNAAEPTQTAIFE